MLKSGIHFLKNISQWLSCALYLVVCLYSFLLFFIRSMCVVGCRLVGSGQSCRPTIRNAYQLRNCSSSRRRGTKSWAKPPMLSEPRYKLILVHVHLLSLFSLFFSLFPVLVGGAKLNSVFCFVHAVERTKNCLLFMLPS